MMHTTLKRMRLLFWIAGLWQAFPAIGYCDIGIPMILPTLYMMIPGLIPVVLIETVIAARSLKVPFKVPLKGIAIANAASTLAGIPLAWAGMTMVSGVLMAIFPHLGDRLGEHWKNVLLRTTWLWPDEPAWVILSAQFILFVPFFFVSYWIERAIARKYYPESDHQQFNRAIFRGNIGSYIFLACVAIILEYR